MRRFLLFAGSIYYPAAGWGDFVSDHDTEGEARAAAAMWREAEGKSYAWWQIVDTQTKTIIAEEDWE